MGDMDSGNSASIQSSSTAGGGALDDQEFESHGGGDGGSGVLFSQSSLASFDNTGSFQLYSLNNGSSTYNNFDPLTNNFDTNFMINQNHNSDRTNNNDLGLLWPSTICSPLDNTNCTTPTTTVGPAASFSPNNNNNLLTRIGPGPVSIPSSGAPLVSDHPGPGGAVRNPKKRSRASRRAPTTVLTTDTNNFRQMVQEFTGIPAPPFSGRTRLDLLGETGIHVSSPGVHQTPYVLRPFPQKIVVPSNHLSINGSLNPQSSINNNNNNNHSVLTLQSLLRPSSSLAVENLYGSGINTGLGCNAAGFLINQFALGQVTTTTTATPTTNAITTTLNQDRLPLGRPVDDGGSSSRSAGTTLENYGGMTRSEGMVDSWICSSD
ncbi:uncharacterized protein LOC141586889 [Silene latifolia]|uniref:uncharacterized protein LOC141586889 n=1 Tax=Silene latifolia TaxID=37657 RepID=UPI003D76C1A3